MVKTLTVFDGSWLTAARVKKPHASSWTHEVMEALDTTGGIYLGSLRLWFDKFPLNSTKQKRVLKTRLESFATSDHLGAVNELSWWEFMCRTDIEAVPIPPTNAPRPDFKVTVPSEFFVEVSTLNVSDAEKRELQAGRGVNLNHSETLRRLLLRVADEKKGQISYAANESRPCGLVLFDYTTWSGFGTEFFRFLATSLLGRGLVFAHVPTTLSALVYVERRVIDGRIAISQQRSAVYYNPTASHALPIGTFGVLRQFWCGMSEAEPKSQEHWLWL
jgi:hypothetical protein